MEKIKFAAQVLVIMTVIPVLFIGTLLGNDTHIRRNASKEHAYYDAQNRAYINGNGKNTRFIISCGMSKVYVKK